LKLEDHDVDLVISDQRMPGMSGLAFLRKVRIEFPDVLTILLTAHGDMETAMEAINEAGVYKFILKPWHDEDLRLTIKRALELRRLVMERNSLRHQVKRRDAVLKEIEKEFPGISNVEKDENGYILLKD